jgi:hypothetical protein
MNRRLPMTTPKSNKTYKRELALAVFLWLVYLSVSRVEALGVVVMPAFAYIGLALGLDWWGKTGPANKSGEGDDR